jgi:hypothetical protein
MLSGQLHALGHLPQETNPSTDKIGGGLGPKLGPDVSGDEKLSNSDSN